MKRPLLVDQRENDRGDFWYVVRGGNRSVDLTSQMYPSRDSAKRAARSFIARIAPVSVLFSYWTGDRPTSGDRFSALYRTLVTERIR